MFPKILSGISTRRAACLLLVGLFAGVTVESSKAQNEIGADLTSYFQVEYAPDGSGYMAWNEHTPSGSSVWLARMDSTSGTMIPADGRGILVASFETQAGFVQFGIDNIGLFIAFPKRATGTLCIARPQAGGGVVITDLPTPPNVDRNTLYASLDPTGPGWISTLHDGHAWLVSLENPAQEIQISDDLVVDRTGPRWTPGKQLVTFGVDYGNKNQLWQVDVSSGTPSSPVLVTDSRHFFDGMFPFVLPDGREAIVAGLDRTQTVGLLVRSPGETVFSMQGLYSTPTKLTNPRATSPEPFLSGNKAYVMYSQYSKSLDGNSDAYHNPGEICIADLSAETSPARLSYNSPQYVFEPEPCYGSYYGYFNAKNKYPVFQLWSSNLFRRLNDPIRLFP